MGWPGGGGGPGAPAGYVPDKQLMAQGREGLGHCGLGAGLGQGRAANSWCFSPPVSLQPLPISRWLALKILGSGGPLT